MAKRFGGELLILLKNAWMNGPTEPTTYPPQKVLCSLFAGVISRLNKAAWLDTKVEMVVKEEKTS